MVCAAMCLNLFPCHKANQSSQLSITLAISLFLCAWLKLGNIRHGPGFDWPFSSWVVRSFFPGGTGIVASAVARYLNNAFLFESTRRKLLQFRGTDVFSVTWSGVPVPRPSRVPSLRLSVPYVSHTTSTRVTFSSFNFHAT